MNFIKPLAIAVIYSLTLTSCKQTDSKPEASKSEIGTEKKVAEKPEIAVLKIDGMTCVMGCARTIEKKLASTEGVQEAKIDFEKKEATVLFDAAVSTPEDLVETVNSIADGKIYTVSDVKIKE